ncbi:FkbM family methyltransferase [Luedemannella helvata]|uniref:Methyltransferase FkbM domain-containing protein n=1 Tax=Luedemannella helvata TaxID=349315 RepID=A0ABN2L353_9ACTN
MRPAGGIRVGLRRAALAAFARVNPGDVRIRHHYTGQPFVLHSFRHKGYWFHGRRREQDEMAAFARLVRPGARVLEVGGHIGYTSLYLASLVGERGAVHVFEPGANNLPYLLRNTSACAQVRVLAAAAGRHDGTACLYLEDLTGQNNSLVADFAGLAANARLAVRARVTTQEVTLTSLDSYCAHAGFAPDFIKIDVEGWEFDVLCGARTVLREHRPALMVEVQDHRAEIAALLASEGYRLLTARGEPLAALPDGTVNVFCLPW